MPTRFPIRLVLPMVSAACVANPDLQGPLPVRNQHPAQLTVLHLPTTGARSLPTGRVLIRGDAAYSNLFLSGTGANGATWIMDGEYLRTAATVRAGLGSGVELGIEVPFAHTSGGFLDAFVIDFHDTFGLPDQNREGNPRDAFEIRAQRNGQDAWRVEQAAWTPLDLPLTLAWQVTDPADGLGVAIRGGIELPTGDQDRGYGNGEVDFAAGVVLEHHALGAGFYGHAQHTLAGSPRAPRAGTLASGSTVARLEFADVTSAGAAAEVPLGAVLTALVQVEWETSTLRRLGIPNTDREQCLLWVGGRFQVDQDTTLEIGFGEDLIGLVSPDFTAWLGMAWVPGGRHRP